ncbi:MAG: aldo/keto reductase, partial [Phycisphaerae bacterium]|nr:aldo/keto reductase [Phycisphaerae bacterium]
MIEPTRRDFLKRSAAATVLASGALSAAASAMPIAPQPAKPAQPTPTPAKIDVERRQFGKTDMKVAILGFGSAEIGFERTEQSVVDKILNAALDQGLNVVDTAECYVDSEEQIGRAIAGRRKEYFLFSKCGHFVKEGGRGDAWDKDAVLHSIERSLTRCKTDVLDLIQLHSCSLETLQKGECIEALEAARKQGKVR